MILCCECWTDEFKNPYVQAVCTFPLGFLQLKFFSPFFSSLFSAKFVINHADVSSHKFCSPRVNILDKLVLGSFKLVSSVVRGGQNPVNHRYIHHTIPHVSVEPSQPVSTTSTPRCFKSFPFPSSHKEKICTKHLHVFRWLPGDQEYGSHTSGRGPDIWTRGVYGDRW